MLFQAYPKAVKNDIYGDLLLHTALSDEASHVVTIILFDAYVKAAKIRNICGELPLDIALYNNASVDVITILLQAYPKAAENFDGESPLHNAIINNVSIDIITMLFQAYPEAVKVKDIYGRLPLHVACESDIYLCNSFLKVLNLLISAYPESIYVTDRHDKLPHGDLPSDFLKKSDRMIMNICTFCLRQSKLGSPYTLSSSYFKPSQRVAKQKIIMAWYHCTIHVQAMQSINFKR